MSKATIFDLQKDVARLKAERDRIDARLAELAPTCSHCGYQGLPEYPLMACPSCFEPLLCPAKCKGGSDSHGGASEPEHHWFHWYRCSWHDGPCETPIWCPCEYGGITLE